MEKNLIEGKRVQ